MPEAIIENENVEANQSGITPAVRAMADKFERLRDTQHSEPEPAPKAPDKPAEKAAEKVVEKPAEPVVEKTGNPLGDDIPISIRSQKAADDFRSIKKRASEAEARLADANKAHEAAIAAAKADYDGKLKATPHVDPKEFETVKSEHQKFKDIVERIGVEFDLGFQEKYQTLVVGVLDGLKASIPDAALVGQITDVLALPESKHKRAQLLELTDALDDFQKNDIAQANRDLRKIGQERDGELAKSREKFAELQKGRQEEVAKIQERLGKAFDEAAARAKDKEKGVFLFQPREGEPKDVEAWNTGVDERVALAKHIFEGNFESDAERADAAFWSAAAKPILDDSIATKKELAELKEQLAKLTNSGPTVGATRGAEKGNEPKTFSEKVKAAFPNQD